MNISTLTKDERVALSLAQDVYLHIKNGQPAPPLPLPIELQRPPDTGCAFIAGYMAARAEIDAEEKPQTKLEILKEWILALAVATVFMAVIYVLCLLVGGQL